MAKQILSSGSICRKGRKRRKVAKIAAGIVSATTQRPSLSLRLSVGQVLVARVLDKLERHLLTSNNGRQLASGTSSDKRKSPAKVAPSVSK